MTDQEFVRDLDRELARYHDSVKADLEAIPEERFWERPVAGMVSAGNLALHVTGNLRHFIGHLLGETTYARNRDREFQEDPGYSREAILTEWDVTFEETRWVVIGLDRNRLTESAPVDRFPGGVAVHEYLVRLVTHLAYHAGQIRMLRRTLAPESL